MPAPRTVIENQTKRPRSAGFTLIEILVTISIIAILAAISIPVMTQLLQRGAEAQTKTLLKQLDSSVSEYEAQTRRKAFVATSYGYPDAEGQAEDFSSFQELYDERLKDLEPALEMVDTVNDQFRVVDPNTAELLWVQDSWDNPVRFFPGTLAFEQNSADAPGQSDLEDKGMYRRKSPYFASAGPDGRWGKIDPGSDQPLADDEDGDAAEDNLYSFEAD